MIESEARRVLGVDATASMAHVRQAYLDLVKVWHPDRFEHDARLREKASQSLQRVNEAYAVLQRSTRNESEAPSFSGASPQAAPRSTPQPNESARATPPTDSASAGSGSRARGVVWLLRHRRDVIAALVASTAGIVLALMLVVGSGDSPKSAGAPPTDGPASAAASDIELPATPRPRASNRRGETRPESGTDLTASGPRGRAGLSIQNALAADAVVELRGDANLRRVVYVREGEKVTMLDLVAGEYRVRLLLGRGWTGKGFSESHGYRERRQPMQVRPMQQGTPTASLAITRGDDELASVAPFRLE